MPDLVYRGVEQGGEPDCGADPGLPCSCLVAGDDGLVDSEQSCQLALGESLLESCLPEPGPGLLLSPWGNDFEYDGLSIRGPP
jgi:hypothetical protein